MQNICDALDCTGCAACAQACPAGCITMLPDDEGFIRPVIEEAACIGCGRCVRTCPSNHVTPTDDAEFYMAWHRDRRVLEGCSSGGVFDALSDIVLADGGSVFGVAMDARTHGLRHVEARDHAGLEAIRLSKYYQADVGDAYLRVRDLLRDGRKVLFTGTPCQVAGLYSVLGDALARSPGLVTMEVLCHGVASVRALEAYLTSKERRRGGKVVECRFRIKEGERGWVDGHGTRLRLRLPDGTEEEWVDPANTYMYGFNRSLFLRESCYRCRYCGTARVADFTAADFWGVGPDHVGDDRSYWGVSLLLAAGPRAEGLMPEVRKRMHVERADRALAIAHNLALTRPQERPALRDRFYREIGQRDYDDLLVSYYRKEMAMEKAKGMAKQVLGTRGTALARQLFKRVGGGLSELDDAIPGRFGIGPGRRRPAHAPARLSREACDVLR